MKVAKRTRNQNNYAIEEVHDYGILLDERELFLHGYANGDDDPGLDYRNSNRLLKNLRVLDSQNQNPITIHQHNIGGDWDAGMLIYDAICACQSRVVMICHGLAASMGSIILQAADCRILMPNCDFMIHEGYSGGSVDVYKISQSNAEKEKHLQEKTLEIFGEVCQSGTFFQEKEYTAAQIIKHIQSQMDAKGDWYLTPSEAVEHGFADGVFGNPKYESLQKIKNG
jgi:ATP-dependent Clp protease protease subunit